MAADLLQALNEIVTVMGPKRPRCCEGCEWEWDEALRIAREAIAAAPAPAAAEPVATLKITDCGPCAPDVDFELANNWRALPRGVTLSLYAAPLPGGEGRGKLVRAWRNRFVSERTATHQRDGMTYEMARAHAESDANEYETALDAALSATP